MSWRALKVKPKVLFSLEGFVDLGSLYLPRGALGLYFVGWAVKVVAKGPYRILVVDNNELNSTLSEIHSHYIGSVKL